MEELVEAYPAVNIWLHFHLLSCFFSPTKRTYQTINKEQDTNTGKNPSLPPEQLLLIMVWIPHHKALV